MRVGVVFDFKSVLPCVKKRFALGFADNVFADGEDCQLCAVIFRKTDDCPQIFALIAVVNGNGDHLVRGGDAVKNRQPALFRRGS